jgi:hypothetical protein
MMQMLAAGGLPPLTDQVRKADADNPRGYYEWESIKQLPVNPALIEAAEGKVVKIISSLLVHLPLNHEYRIVFMRRPLSQVVASQAEMMQRRGNVGPRASSVAMQGALETHLRSVTAWMGERSSMAVHWVDYPDLVSNPAKHAAAVAAFLGGRLEVERMIAQVDPLLFRIR